MKLIHQLKATSSRLNKEQLLKNISKLEYQVFFFAYHPDSIYHLKFKFPLQEARADIYSDLEEPTEEMFNLLDRVINGDIRGQKARDAVQAYASRHGSLIFYIVNKDLDCGVTATLFNKVHPGAIPQFKVMLAKEVDIKTINYPVLAQLKYDGVRLIAIVEDRKCIFKTRNGKIVHLPELAKQIEYLPFNNYILDGEIVLDNGKQEDRTKISGMINSAMHGGSIIETAMQFHIFDTMPLSDFNAYKCETIYEDRFTVLRNILASGQDFNALNLATTNEVHSAEAATNLYEVALLMGYEGLVLKYPNHKYTFKRSKDWIKIKEVKHADLIVTEIQVGTGKYEDMIGALVCEGIVEGKQIKVNVGSGLSDLQRGLDDGHFLHNTVEILYNTIIQDSVTKEWSLFLPRFVMVRFDK